VATRANKPLLAPGNEAKWAEINREKEGDERELVARMSVGERLELGQRLSQQRTKLFNEYRARHGLDGS
jgi:hypothetical protein